MDIYDDGKYKLPVPAYKRTNALLVRNPLGEVKPTTWSLPPRDHIYGYADAQDEEGASEVVNSWLEHQGPPRELPGRNFVELNKFATMSGCTTAKNLSQFRRTNDVRLGAQNAPISHMTSSFPDSSTIFGRPSPQSAPISDLLNNNYQRTWIQGQRYQREMKSTKQRPYARSQHTKASLGHTKVRAPPPKKMFKLKQFENVPSRISMTNPSYQNDYSSTYQNERARSTGRRSPIAGRRATPQQMPQQSY